MDYLLLCAGCKKSFHTSCVNVENVVYHAMQSCKNLFWNCDDCVEGKVPGDATNMILKKLEAMSADIESLKSKQGPPRKPFSELFTPKRTDDVRTPGSKRKRTENVTATPVIAHGTGDVSSELVTVKPLKWLYVTMLHPSTTEEAIAKQLSKSLNAQTTDFNCVKLLAKDVQSPTYISFKIGMSEDLFTKSLEPSAWPEGVAFREFVNRPRRFFRPTGVRLPQ
jgi:hypothetical protein